MTTCKPDPEQPVYFDEYARVSIVYSFRKIGIQ